MKRTIKALAVIAAVVVSAFTASARTSYRGFLEVDIAGSISNSEPNNPNLKFVETYSPLSALVFTTHGAQLNRSFFVGGGVGVDIISEGTLFLPIYAAARWDLNITSKFTPFVSCKLGACIGIRSNSHYIGFITPSEQTEYFYPGPKDGSFYCQPTVGIRFRLHHHMGLNVGLTLISNTYGLDESYEPSQYYGSNFNCLSCGLNISLDF